MVNALQAYAVTERVVGRGAAWRIGRWLYLGARRELLNDPRHNGEYALQTWVVAAMAGDHTGAVFLDVGANLGDWTGSLVGVLERHGASEWQIHAVEPAPALLARLRQRFAERIGQSAIYAVPQALGAAEGRLPFFVTGEEAGSSSLLDLDRRAPSERISVEVTTIDRYLAARRIDAVAFLKIDTEGNDFNVILGGREAICNGRINIIQFEYNWRWIPFGHSLWKVFAFAAEVGYRVGRLTMDGVEIYDSWHPELDRFIETNFVMGRPQALDRLPHRVMKFGTSNTPVETA